ncbi:hypothetical protein J5751_02560 [bacterium]|nr:hypothetical protein [bacterium]
MPGNVNQETIAADGSTEVDIYYSRRQYTVYWTYMLDGTTEGISTTAEESYLFGQTPEYKLVSGYQTDSTVYTFNGWYDENYHTYFS